MTEPFTKKNVAEMAERAAGEIESLRAQIASLQPKAHAYDTVTQILGLLPQNSRGYSEDIAHKLRRRAAELREPEEKDDGA